MGRWGNDRPGGGRGRPVANSVSRLRAQRSQLSQRAWIALTELGHDLAIAVVDSAAAMEAAVREHHPQLIVCPFLKQMIPESIWTRHPCLVVRPGPIGDRGPSSLDWAIELGAHEWRVTAVERGVTGRARPLMTQAVRAIDDLVRLSASVTEAWTTSAPSRCTPYRKEALARSRECFFGPDPSYHLARRRFVHKLGPAHARIPRVDPARVARRGRSRRQLEEKQFFSAGERVIAGLWASEIVRRRLRAIVLRLRSLVSCAARSASSGRVRGSVPSASARGPSRTRSGSSGSPVDNLNVDASL